MVHSAFGVGQHGEGRLERLCILAGAFGRIAQNHQHVRAGGLKILVHAPQLGDVRSALQSVVFAHKEQNDVRFAFVFRQTNLPTAVRRQVEIGRRGTDIQFIAHNSVLLSQPLWVIYLIPLSPLWSATRHREISADSSFTFNRRKS